MNEHPLTLRVDTAPIGVENCGHQTITRHHRRVVRRATGFMGALGVVGLMLAGCGATRNNSNGGSAATGAVPSGGSAVTGTLDEWHVLADTSSVPAGSITFTFKNTGKIVHEMLITRTDTAPGQIVVEPGTKKFNEDDPTSKVVDEVSELAAGKTGSVTVDLTAGTYQLVCNVPGHYTHGMYMTLTVTP